MDENIKNLTGKKNNAMALTSFIVSLCGLVIAGIPCGVVSIVFGGIAMAKFNPETQKNKWMAIVGLILGVVDIIATILVLPMVFKRMGIM